ncbi:MAG: ribonuclease III [Clostridia bacterium]|nr:ribonuclease III [Clostridia bacterium]
MFGIFTTVSETEARNFNPVTLAFVGDAVFTVYVREKLVVGHTYSTGTLQKLSAAEVSAHGQNTLLEKLLPLLTEDEVSVFKRGRNAKKPTRSKNATVSEYNNSTGFEALIGYLYLTGQYKRIEELLSNSDED